MTYGICNILANEGNKNDLIALMSDRTNTKCQPELITEFFVVTTAS
ncbi:hypothetical protein [Nostoc sp. MG11]|nr:hypothetical protein [Nostoc sp. MG11]